VKLRAEELTAISLDRLAGAIAAAAPVLAPSRGKRAQDAHLRPDCARTRKEPVWTRSMRSAGL
jgi:hypothetical protein